MLTPHAETIRTAESAVAGHVSVLRGRNVSWTRIGAAFGISKQAAWERFANEAAERGLPKGTRNEFAV
jgi:ATP-dependent Clp protease ATP-binding subunit ClpX